MAKGLLRLGRLGYFAVMAGVSWVVEACSGSSGTPVDPTAMGGGAAAGTGLGGTSGGASGASSKGGTNSGSTGLGGSAATGRGGEGGLHDVPCE